MYFVVLCGAILPLAVIGVALLHKGAMALGDYIEGSELLPKASIPPPAQQLTPYRGDAFGQNLSSENELREENERLRVQLTEQNAELDETPVKISEFSKWMNAIANAYADGVAPWLYPDGTSEAVRVWNREGDDGLVVWAMAHGITLKRKRK